MKNIIATTAIALMLGTSAFAAKHTMALQTYQVMQKSDIYASNFIGMRVYSAEKDFDTFDENTMVNEGSEKEWDDIGEINDVVLGKDGSVKAVILGIGGFIGIGERDIAVSMKSIKFVNEKDDPDDFFLVVKANKEMLTKAEEFKRAKMDDKSKAKEETKMAKTEMEPNDPDRTMLKPPIVTRDGYREAKMEELTTETLTGARVYGSKNEDIGEIDRLIVDDSGQIKRAIIDVGGFLGIGEHPIAVTLKELNIQRTDGGDDVRVYIDATQAELEKQPAYKN